jgi:hypothetical protein
VSYSFEEQETVICTDALMKWWDVSTRQRKYITKIKKVTGIEIIAEELNSRGNVVSGRYRLPLNAITFRKLHANSLFDEEEAASEDGGDGDADELFE